MKREFLQSLKIGEQFLPKETVDAIMAENGRDIQKVRNAFADYESLRQQVEQLTAHQQQQETLRQEARSWEEKYRQAKASHEAQIRQMEFSHLLDSAIRNAGGRCTRAITAMLDLDALQASENQSAALDEALETLKKQESYLFLQEQLPPPYASGTGAEAGADKNAPVSLAGALREKFERK